MEEPLTFFRDCHNFAPLCVFGGGIVGEGLIARNHSDDKM